MQGLKYYECYHIMLLSEIHGLPVWRSLLSRACQGSAEEGRNDTEVPRELEM